MEGNSMEYNASELVIRTDFNFRTKYPEVKTRIFHLKNQFYAIFCENLEDRFQKISEDFDYKIRPVATPVKLVEKLPDNYKSELIPINDINIPNNYKGISMRTIDMLNLLSGKFPQLDIRNIIGNEGDQKIKLHIKGEIPNEIKENFSDFINNLNQGVPIITIENSDIKRLELFENPALYLYSSRLEKAKLKVVERDEEFWYNNIEKFYDGSFDKSSLPFLDTKRSNCYADFSRNENLSIRNHLLLYDTTYISLPIEKPINDFLSSQKITEEDFAYLVKENRIKILLTQSEKRYDTSFLKNIYSYNPNSIISRRAINAALIIDLMDLQRNFFITDLDLTTELYDIAKIFSSISKSDINELYNLLSWPVRAFRESFSYLENSSPIRIGAIGVNNVIQDSISNRIGKDVRLEFMFAGNNIHIASALNSAYYPSGEISGYSDRHYANILSQILAVYKNLTTEKTMSYTEYKKNLNTTEEIVSPINAFEINEYIPIDEFSDFTKKIIPSERVVSLLTYLNNLNEDEREEKIKLYNQEIKKLVKKRGTIRQSFDFTYSAALDTAGLWIPFLGTGTKGLELISDKVGISHKAKKKIMDKFDSVIYSKDKNRQNISLLSKISPIARLKRE
jgi:hypothetical protein